MTEQPDFIQLMTMTADQAPTWFKYEDSHLSFLEHELPRIGPWRFLTAENQASLWRNILSKHNADCVPIIACLASDEMIGCHFVDGTSKLVVFTIYDPPEFGVEKHLFSFWDALHYIVDDIRFRTEA
jgi:hypothetical protein